MGSGRVGTATGIAGRVGGITGSCMSRREKKLALTRRALNRVAAKGRAAVDMVPRLVKIQVNLKGGE